MGQYPVTQAEWEIVAAFPQVNRKLESNPSRFKGERLPVERVTWYDAVEFCDRLSQHTNRPYRLPTEAEWEYACRSVISYQLSVTSEESSQNPSASPLSKGKGGYPPFHFGETISAKYANYDARKVYGRGEVGEYRQKTTPVDYFGVANAWGLSDMHGNVWEWCQDHWHENYEGAPTDGSAWLTDDKNSPRVVRGGSWLNDPRDCRSADRYRTYPVITNDNQGFRLVCAPR
jgi:formylglycine-generating enzyme required for sulfatase activity